MLQKYLEVYSNLNITLVLIQLASQQSIVTISCFVDYLNLDIITKSKNVQSSCYKKNINKLFDLHIF